MYGPAVPKPSPVSSILLFISGAILLYCAFGTGWFNLGEEGGAGLARVSFDGHSQWFLSDRHVEIEGVLGTAAAVFTFAASVLAIITGAILLRPGRSVLAVLALIAMIVAMLFAFAFTAKVKEHGIAFGAGFYLFLLCSALVITGAVMGMSRAAAAMPMGYPGMPMQQPYGGMPMQQQQPYGGQVAQAPVGPPCNTCGTQATFVQQYAKYYCQRCNRYLV